MSGLVALTLLTLVGFEPPAPKLDPTLTEAPGSADAPVEGPAQPPGPSERDPASDPEPSDGETPDGELPGVEFAPLPEPEDDEEDDSQAETRQPEVWWPDPGNAPADGSGFFMGGGVLVPAAAIVTWALLRDSSLSSVDRSGIWVAGGGMELLGLIAIGMGGVRRAKLIKWANAYRVIPLPQGSGLLTLGGLGVTTGLTLVPLGIYTLARGGSSTAGLTMLAIGLVTGGVIAPLGLSFGTRRHKLFLQTGGWRRRPIPQLTLTPTLSITGRNLWVGVHGRF